MKKMAAPKPIIKLTNDTVLCETRNKQSESLVILLTPDLLIRDISQSGVCEFFGKEKHALINASFIDLLVEQRINSEELIALLNSHTNELFHHFLLEHRTLKKNYSATLLCLQENNQYHYVITLTALQNAYHALNSYMDAIINSLPGAVYWKDRDGHYMGCNKFVATMAGFAKPEEMIGKTDFDLCWREFADDWRLLDNMVIQQDATIEREEKAKLASGKIITELTFKTPLKNLQGETIGVIGTSLDITERKEMEAALRESQLAASAASQAKTEFLANMRHDIRTPLSGIVGFSEILKMESSEPRIREYADNLVASSHALLDLMDEVLEAVRVSSGEIPMLKRKFNLNDTLKQVMDLYAARAREKNLALTVTMDPRLPNYVIGDKIRLHRITLELVGNALNFTNSGSVSVIVTLAKQENRHLVIKMTVTDTGMGIPKDKQQEIYLQFKRLTPSYQGIYKGAGLGLFVIKQFIDELGGEIYVNSETDKGTCFTCLIPLQASLLDDDSGMDSAEDLIIEKPYMTPLKQQANHPPASEKHPATTRVLVVEDNGIAQMAAKTLLSAMSCQVDIAANGADALVLCDKNYYDLIFMDIGLGASMDGYEVTHHLRAKPEVNHIPIIALTAHGSDDNKQRCIEAGMDALLTKPLTHAHAADILSIFIPARRAATPEKKQPCRLDLPDNNAELFQLGQFAILDSEQALRNCGNQVMMMELLSMMLTQEMPKDLAAMKQAFQDRDYALVEKIAHKIKGGAVYVGTTRMKYACQYVERYWKTGERELFDVLYHQAITVIEETCLYIKAWLDEQSTFL